MFGLLSGGASKGPLTFTDDGSWTVPAGVTLITRLELVAPGGAGGNFAAGGGDFCNGGGGGGGEICVATDIPVTPNSVLTFTLDLTGSSGNGNVSVVHPTLGTLNANQGDVGADATLSPASGAGGQGGGTNGGAGGGSVGGNSAGLARSNGTSSSDTATWSGVTITRYGGGGGGSGSVDNDEGTPPTYDGGDGGAHGFGGTTTTGAIRPGKYGGGQVTLVGLGSVQASGGLGGEFTNAADPPVSGYFGTLYITW